MKKIVGIIAAVAMIATSVFAADITAKVRLDGELFNYAGSVSGVKINHNAGEAHNPLLAWSYGDDKSGANGKVWTIDPAMNVTSGEFKIWFSPIDNVKLIFGHQDFNLNQEQLQWWRSQSGSAGGQGYGVNYSADGFSFDLLLAGGWGNNWLNGSAIGATNVKIQYGADFGTIAAILVAQDTFKDIKFGVGYNNNFDGLFMFVNVLGFVKSSFEKVRVEAFAKGNVDSFGWAAWIPFDFTIAGSKAAVGANVKFTFNQFYLDIQDDNFLADSFAMTIKPGMTGSVGKAGYEVAISFGIGSSVTVAVPVNFTVEW